MTATEVKRIQAEAVEAQKRADSRKRRGDLYKLKLKAFEEELSEKALRRAQRQARLDEIFGPED